MVLFFTFELSYTSNLIMDKSNSGSFLGFVFSKLFLKQLAIAGAIVFSLSLIAFFSLRFYTKHGEFVEVPNLKNQPLEQSIEQLEAIDLTYEIIDSVYFADKPSGTVIEQTPAPQEKIKKQRKIFLIINSYSKPLVVIPDVRDLSYRNAKATLESMGFMVVKIEYVRSEFKDLVKDVKKGRQILSPGDRISQGSRLTLVVGGNQAQGAEIPCPSFRGLSYESALRKANLDSLNIRSAEFDIPAKNKADSALFVVYKQSPLTKSPISTGSSVKIWLTKNKELLATPEEEFLQLNQDSIKKSQNKKDIETFF